MVQYCIDCTYLLKLNYSDSNKFAAGYKKPGVVSRACCTPAIDATIVLVEHQATD